MDTLDCGSVPRAGVFSFFTFGRARWARWALDTLLALAAAVVLAACGGNGSNPATPVAPAITTQPASAAVTAGQSASFSVVAGGSDPLAYQWQRNGIDVAGATSASLTVTAAAGDNGALYTVLVSNAAGSATSNAATLTVNTIVAPAITTQPAAVSVTAGSPATFTVVASGSDPLAYKWRRNASDIAGATSASYTLAAPALADNGAVFSVRVSNAGGEVVSANAILSVTAAIVAPAIATQAANQTVNAGQTATFSVTATGTAPLTYQWRRNGSNIAGATAASYTTAATVDADNGARFSVVVSNAAPTPATSSDAVLTVTPVLVAPAITTQPANASVNVGASATFSVVATGSAPLAYQWRKNGVPIAGANAASYTTPATVAGDDGARFSVVVSNATSTAATSDDATLTVLMVWAGIREDGPAGFSRDDARGVATDTAGNVVIGGRVDNGQFSFDPPGLQSSAYVAKYSAGGQGLWAHKSPATGSFVGLDQTNGVATDAGGNIYATGMTVGTLPGQISAGVQDVTVMKYDAAGTLLWARQFGSNTEDYGLSIAVDTAGNSFVVGYTLGGQLPLQPPRAGWMFIAKYDTNGNRQWLRQWGGDGGGGGDFGRGVAVDAAGNAYMTGEMTGDYAGTSNPGGANDAVVAKYDTNGNQVWFSRLEGLGGDLANAIAVAADGNTIYFTGRTHTDFSLPGYPAQLINCCMQPDVFVARLNGSGILQWVQNLTSVAQPGPTYFWDEALGIATNAAGSTFFITGYTLGVMPTETSKGDEDIFVVRYEADGTRTWIKQFGADIPATAARHDRGRGITIDRNGDLFVVGEAVGTFGTPNPSTDRTDWFVMKLKPADGSPY